MNHYFPDDKVNPYVIGVLDSETILINPSIISETIETYYDFNETLKISPPREAIESLAGPRECRLCHKGTITMAKSLPSGLIGRTAAQSFPAAWASALIEHR